MKSDDPLLQLANVSKQYETGSGREPVPVLVDVSLDVPAGESLAIIGPSGSGKSTLLNLMAALDRPTAGRISLAGRELQALSDREMAQVRNREIGLVFQFHHLLPQCTVVENVLLPTLAGQGTEGGPAALDRARAILEQLGLGERLDHVPGQLSGGECQRVAVARALINKPKVLLADEPTGALDRQSSDALGDLLVGLNTEQGVTLIVVTHSASLASRMRRQLELRDGRLQGGEQ